MLGHGHGVWKTVVRQNSRQGSGTDPLAPGAPDPFTWDTGPEVNTPTWTADFDDTKVHASGDIDGSNYDDIELEVDTDPSFGSPDFANNVLDAAELLAGSAELTIGPLADGTWYSRVRHNHVVAGGDHFSPYSVTVSKTIAVAPTISVLSPADDATGVVATVNPVATFNKNIQFGTGTIDLFDSDDDLIESFDVATDVGVGAGQVSISGAVLTINPTAAMESNKGHYVQFDATAIESTLGAAFAGIADKTTWSFTTEAAGVVVTHLQHTVISTDLTTYNFGSQGVGTGAGKLLMLVEFRGINVDNEITAAVDFGAGDVACTSLVKAKNVVNNSTIVEWFVVDTPGGSGTPKVVASGTGGVKGTRCVIDLWHITGWAGTAADTATDIVPSGATLNASIDCPAGGAIFGGAIFAPSTNAISWTGLANETVDEAVEGTRHGAAYEGFASAQTNLSISAVLGTSATPGLDAMALVSVGP